MRILRINSLTPDKEMVGKAVKILEAGGLIVYPTETLYGLGANPFNDDALQRVFEAKGRDLSKPISLAFRDLEQVEKYAVVSPVAKRLMKKLLPGPLTVLLPSKLELDESLGGNKIGVRIPDNKVALALLNRIKFPLTATSANLSGGKNPATALEAAEQVGDKVDLVLDAGKCKYSKPSTVVDLSSGEVEIVREGVVTEKEIMKLLKK